MKIKTNRGAIVKNTENPENKRYEKLLSIGMIVKNEEKHLRKCLEALKPLREKLGDSCQLVIADTGSTDSTKEIALEFADKVLNFEWCNDFAQARNFVLDNCSSEWHLFIDADEYLKDGADELIKFLRNKELNKKYYAAFITIESLTSGHIQKHTDDEDYFIAYSNPARLFRTFNNKFTSAIHECAEITYPALTIDFILTHYGYLYETKDEFFTKRRRNMELLEIEYNKDPKNLQMICYCLDSAFDPDDIKKYMDVGYDILKEKTQSPSAARFCNFYAKQCRREKKYSEIIKLCDFYLPTQKEFTFKIIDLIYELAYAYIQLENIEKAQKYTDYYLNLLQMDNNNTIDREHFEYTVLIHNTLFEKNNLKILLIEKLIKQNKLDDCRQYFENLNILEIQTDICSTYIQCIFYFSQIKNEYGYVYECYKCSYNLDKNSNKYIEFKNALDNFLLYNMGNICNLAQAFTEEIDDNISKFMQLIKRENSLNFDETFNRYISFITNWEDVFPQLYFISMQKGLKLPLEAFMLSENRINTIITYNAKANKNYKDILLLYLLENEDIDDVLIINYICIMLSKAMMLCLTIEDKNIPNFLKYFKYYSKKYMNNIFKDDVINDITIYSLKDIYQFAYMLDKSDNLLKQNDLSNYIKTLKNIIKIAPQYAVAVNYIIKEFEEKNEKDIAEFEMLKWQIQNSIDYLINSNQIEQAKKLLQEYMTLCPNDEKYNDILANLTKKK